jgi:hypothetical protein
MKHDFDLTHKSLDTPNPSNWQVGMAAISAVREQLGSVNTTEDHQQRVRS